MYSRYDDQLDVIGCIIWSRISFKSDTIEVQKRSNVLRHKPGMRHSLLKYTIDITYGLLFYNGMKFHYETGGPLQISPHRFSMTYAALFGSNYNESREILLQCTEGPERRK